MSLITRDGLSPSHLQSGFKISRHYLIGPPQMRVPTLKEAWPRFPDRRPNMTRGVFGMAGLAAGFGTMSHDFTLIGYRDNWGHEGAFGLSRADARQHLYVIGKTGSGKTTLLRNLILQHIEVGDGVGL